MRQRPQLIERPLLSVGGMVGSTKRRGAADHKGDSMKKRLVQILGLFLCVQILYDSVLPQHVVAKESIKPDVVALLKDEIRATPDWDKDCTDTTTEISIDDANKLMKIAQAEAGTEGVYGQFLVMCVILNRLNSDDYPNSIGEIISQKNQFETYSKGVYQDAEPTVDSHLALALLEKNIDTDLSIIGFETKANGESLLQYFDYSYTYGNHNFYINKKN